MFLPRSSGRQRFGINFEQLCFVTNTIQEPSSNEPLVPSNAGEALASPLVLYLFTGGDNFFFQNISPPRFLCQYTGGGHFNPTYNLFFFKLALPLCCLFMGGDYFYIGRWVQLIYFLSKPS